MTRGEISTLSDFELAVVADGCRNRIRAAWDRGESGRLDDIFSLALVLTEGALRGTPLPPRRDPSWFVLFDPDDMSDVAA